MSQPGFWSDGNLTCNGLVPTDVDVGLHGDFCISGNIKQINEKLTIGKEFVESSYDIVADGPETEFFNTGPYGGMATGAGDGYSVIFTVPAGPGYFLTKIRHGCTGGAPPGNQVIFVIKPGSFGGNAFLEYFFYTNGWTTYPLIDAVATFPGMCAISGVPRSGSNLCGDTITGSIPSFYGPFIDFSDQGILLSPGTYTFFMVNAQKTSYTPVNTWATFQFTAGGGSPVANFGVFGQEAGAGSGTIEILANPLCIYDTGEMEISANVNICNGNLAPVIIEKDLEVEGSLKAGTELDIEDFDTTIGNPAEGWTNRTIQTGSWFGLVYASTIGRWVAGGDPAAISTSDDGGVTWTARTSAHGSGTIYGMAFSPTLGSGMGRLLYTNTGAAGAIATSDNGGVSWTARTTSSPSTTWSGCTWGTPSTGHLFVAVATVSTGIMTSPDGITWTNRTDPSTGNWCEVTWGTPSTGTGGRFVAVGVGGIIATSDDGITWTNRTSPVSDLSAVTWGNGQFVAVAETAGANQAITSPDGITWTVRTTGFNRRWRGITYSPELNLYLAVAWDLSNQTTFLVMTSPDGINWTNRELPEPPSITGLNIIMNAVGWDGTNFVALGYNIAGGDPRVYTSPDADIDQSFSGQLTIQSVPSISVDNCCLYKSPSKVMSARVNVLDDLNSGNINIDFPVDNYGEYGYFDVFATAKRDSTTSAMYNFRNGGAINENGTLTFISPSKNTLLQDNINLIADVSSSGTNIRTTVHGNAMWDVIFTIHSLELNC